MKAYAKFPQYGTVQSTTAVNTQPKAWQYKNTGHIYGTFQNPSSRTVARDIVTNLLTEKALQRTGWHEVDQLSARSAEVTCSDKLSTCCGLIPACRTCCEVQKLALEYNRQQKTEQHLLNNNR